MKKHKLYLIFLVCIVLVLTFSSCKTKKDDGEIAQPYTEQASDENDAVEQQTENDNEDIVQDAVNTSVSKSSEPTDEQQQQTSEQQQTTEEQPLEQQPVVDEEKTEEKSTEVFGEGILEYIDISKVAKLEFACPGEALSTVTLETIKTITAAEDIKKVIDTLSQVSYTEKQKLFEEGDYIIAEPSAYRLTLYDADGKHICYLDLKSILNNKNTVLVKNYKYTVEDSAKIDALITENIRSNCDCYICTTETLVSSQDCEICKQDKSNGKFCKCEK